MSYHDAQICKNGHLITSYADKYVSSKENYCSDCGAKTIMNCPSCKLPIRGSDSEYGYLANYEVPSYCHNCGNPYPWTAERLSVAKEILELDSQLSDDDKTQLSDNMQYLVADTPRTQLAAMKFKKFLSKAGTATTSALRDIFIDVASETAKKIIWPD